MISRTLILPLVGVLLPLAPLVAQDVVKAAAREGFEHVLPASTWAYLGTSDSEALNAGLRASAFGRWWNDPGNAAFREALSQQVSMLGQHAEAVAGADPLELLGMVHGRVALAALDRFEASDEEQPVGLTLALLADMGEQHEAAAALLETLTGKLAEQEHVVSKTVTIGETEVSSFEFQREEDEASGRLQLAFHGETLVLTLSFLPVEHDPMERLLAGLEDEPGQTLASAASFKGSVAAQPGGLQLWIDGSVFADAARADMESSLAGADDEDFFKDYYQQMLDLQRNLGLPELGAIAFHCTWSAQGSRGAARVEWPGKGWIPGFGRLLLGGGGESLLASVPGDALSVFCARTDFGGLFDGAMKAMIDSGQMQPSEATDFLAQTEEQLGFNIRDDLIEALDGRVAFVSAKVPAEERLPMSQGDPQNFAALIGLSDGKQLSTLLDGVLRSTGLIAARQRLEFQGFELFSVPLMPGMSINYSVTPDLLVASLSSTLVQDVLRRKAGSGDLPVLAENPDYKSRRALLAGCNGLLQYSNAAASMKGLASLLDGLREMVKVQAEEPDASNPFSLFAASLQSLPPLDPALFDKHFKGATLVCVSADEGGFSMESTSP
jgi:hypothetical protein